MPHHYDFVGCIFTYLWVQNLTDPTILSYCGTSIFNASRIVYIHGSESDSNGSNARQLWKWSRLISKAASTSG
jgi:hypothetical protein